mmetsp:Transcript_21190/g.35913  ORF Transcript_21190/g.35913 Transcript_21190/m.35913 type:complete len:364 (-) Transcript_21190:84-1175(-)
MTTELNSSTTQSYGTLANVPLQQEPPTVRLNGVVLTIFVYLLVGVLAFHFVEDLNLLDSLYITVITFTTVGYGDYAPKLVCMKLFTILFILFGLMIVGHVVDILFDYIVQKRIDASKEKLISIWFGIECDDSGTIGDDDIHAEVQLPLISENATSSSSSSSSIKRSTHLCSGLASIVNVPSEIVRAFVGSIVMISLTIAVGVLFYIVLDEKDVINAVYLATATVSTVGYGDIVPTHDSSKLFTCLYAVVGAICFGRAISDFIGAVSDHHLHCKHTELLNASVLDYSTFAKANTDGTDRVTREEFLVYRLIQMGLLEEPVKNLIYDQYARMDKDKNGILTIDDIMIAHRKRVERATIMERNRKK